MSSRQYLYDVVEETLNSAETEDVDRVKAVVDNLLPWITEPKQMRGVPEGSILLVEIQAGARAVRWEDGHLHGNLRADQMPMTPDWVIERYGPLTVVWMP